LSNLSLLGASALLGITLLAAASASAQAPPQFAQLTFPSVNGALMREAVLADLDGDGDLDLCGGTGLFSFTLRQVLLRNDGQAGWTDLTATALPNVATSTLATIAFDLEGDGDLDLLVSKQQAPSRLWRNNGAGVFTDASALLPAAATDHLTGVARDVDGDGDVDVVLLAGYFSTTTDLLLRNQGAGPMTAVPLTLGSGATSIAACDLDLDGAVDLVVGTQTGLRVHRNTGAGVFTDVSAAWTSALPAGLVLSVAAGDLDGDGDPDLVAGRQNVTTDLRLTNTGTAFTVAALLPGNPSGAKSCVLFDADEDGDLDLVRGSITASVTLAINDGSGVLSPSPQRMANVQPFSPTLRAGDVDGDGDDDLVVLDEVSLTQTLRLITNRHRDLTLTTPVIGLPWTIDVVSAPGYATLDHVCRLGIGLGVLPQPLVVPGVGALWLDFAAGGFDTAAIVFAATGTHRFTIPVPQLPPLVGLPLHVQALLEQARAPARFTGHRRVVVQ